MLALLRAIGSEVARGLATGAIVWSGRQSCQACPPCTPTFVCPEPPRFPDCVCHAAGTSCHTVPREAARLEIYLVATVCLCLGFALGFVFQKPRQSPRGQWGLRLSDGNARSQSR